MRSFKLSLQKRFFVFIMGWVMMEGVQRQHSKNSKTLKLEACNNVETKLVYVLQIGLGGVQMRSF